MTHSSPKASLAAEFATVEKEAAEKAIAAIEACLPIAASPFSAMHCAGLNDGMEHAQMVIRKAFGLEEKQV